MKKPKYSFEDGVHYFNTGDYRRSAVIFYNLVSSPFIKDEEGTLSLLLGISLLRIGKYTLAEKYLLEARFKTKNLEDYAHFFLAKAFFNNGEFEEAMETLELLLMKFPDSIFTCDALLMKTEIGFKLGFLDEVRNVLREYTQKMCKVNSRYMLYEGKLEFRTGDVEKSRNTLLKAWSTYHGKESIIEDTMDKFFGSIERVITSEMLENKMKSLITLRDFHSIIRLYKRFKNRSDEILLNVGKAFYYLKKYKVAIKILKKVKDSKKCDALFFIAKAYNRMGDIERAVSIYRNIAEKYTNCEYADNALYKISVLKNENNKKILHKIVEKFPHSDILPLVLWKLGWQEAENGDYQTAISYLKKILTSEVATKNEKSRARFWICEFKRRTEDKNWQNLCKEQVSESDFNYYTVSSIHLLNYKDFTPEWETMNTGEIQLKNLKIELWRKAGVFEFVRREVAHIARYYPHSLTIYVLNLTQDFPEMRKFVKEKDATITFPQGFKHIVIETAYTFKLDPYLLFALIKAESEFNRYAVSSAGARGLTQIIPSTANHISTSMMLKKFEMSRLFDPKINILMGGWYLKKLITEFKAIVPALSAYNGGPSNVQSWCKKWGALPTIEFIEYIPFSETQNYVKKIIAHYIAYQLLYKRSPNTESIFVEPACP